MLLSLITLALLASGQRPTLRLGYCGTKLYNWAYCASLDVAHKAVKYGEVTQIPGATYDDTTGELQDFEIELHRMDHEGNPSTGTMIVAKYALVMDPPMNAILGCGFSGVTSQAGSFGAAAEMVMIGYSSTAPSLSNKNLYPFFFRACMPDALQAVALFMLVTKHDYTVFNVLSGTDSYSGGLAAEVATLDDQNLDVTATFRTFEYSGSVELTDEYFDENWGSALRALKENENRVWMLCFPNEQFMLMINYMLDTYGAQLFNDDHMFILCETFAMNKDDIAVTLDDKGFNLNGAVVTRPATGAAVFDALEEYYKTFKIADFDSFCFHDAYSSVMEKNISSNTQEEIKAGKDSKGLYMDSMFDAYFTFALSVQQMLGEGVAPADIKGQALLDVGRSQTFEGGTGNVAYDENGDNSGGGYVVLQISAGYEQSVVGKWTGTNGGSISFDEPNSLVYPGGSSTPPQDRPTVCADFKYLQDDGATCSPCLAGTGGPLCEPCAAGFFRVEDDEDMDCTPCPPGELSTEEGSTSCDVCPAGAYCPQGSAIATPCSVGHSCEERSVFPQMCVPGFEQPLEGQEWCDPCQAGYHATTQGTVKCASCQPGYYSVQGNLTDGDGVDIYAGTVTCSPCTNGFYMDHTNGTACDACLAPLTSPALTTQLPAASSKADCVCPVDTYWSVKDPANPCRECQEGTECPGGNEVPLIKEKYTAETVPKDATIETFIELKVWRCVGAFEVCQGTTLPTEYSTNNKLEYEKVRLHNFCPDKFSTNGCSRCPDNFWISDAECKECTGGDNALYPVIYILGLVAMFMLYKLTENQAARKLTNMMMLSCSCSILLNFFQMLGVVGFYHADFPDFLGWFFDFFKLFVFDIEVLKASCALGAGFKARFLTRVVSPLVFLLSFAALYPITMVLSKVTSKVGEMNPLDVMNTCGLITNAGYIALCKISMQYYECKDEPHADATVAAYPDVNCNSDDHESMFGLAIIMTVLYGAGIWCMCVYLCYMAPKRIVESNDFRRKVRFLVGRWDPSRWYWGPVLQTRNLVVACVAVGYPADGTMQFLVTASIVAIYTAAQATMEPWRDLNLNVTDTILGLAITLVCLFAVLLVEDIGDKTEREDHAKMYLVIIFIIAFVMLVRSLGNALFAILKPAAMTKVDKDESMQATKVLLLQTKHVFNLYKGGTSEKEFADALEDYMTHTERKNIFKIGKVLLHEMCGVKYLSDNDYARLMVNEVEAAPVDVDTVTADALNTKTEGEANV